MRKYFRRPSTATQPPPPLPLKPHTKSIGSKIAATFSHTRLPKPSQSEPARPSTAVSTSTISATRPSTAVSASTISASRPSTAVSASTISASTFSASTLSASTLSAFTHSSSTLSASSSRPASYESGSSSDSWPRSTTPRPSQPLITVSLSPDNLSEYKNLFTRPPAPDSDVTPSPTSPASPTSRLPKFDSPIYPRRGQTPASAIAAAHRQATGDGDDRSPSRSSRYSRKNSDSDKGHEETQGHSGAQESPRATPDGEKGLPPSLQRHPSPVTRLVQSSENVNSSSIRSRMKPTSNSIRSGPPLIPLPQTPSSPPSELLLRQASNVELEAASAQKSIARPRAHTIGSVGNSHPADQLTPNTTATSSPSSTDIPEANIDIDTASTPQLRAALIARSQQYEIKVANLEKKVLSLEKEVARKDKELKGLRWIINNGDSSQPHPLSTGVINHSLLSPTTLSEPEDNTRIISGVTRRLYYQSDSGTESHAESLRSAASGSDSVSSFRHKSLRKPFTPAEVTPNFCHAGSSRRPSKMPPGLGAEKVLEMPNKRSSLSSVSPSPSSSTSSLLPPSPSITMSSLSAIPEGPPSALRPSLRYDNSDQEERRALRASHRISTSSMTSSSTAASSAYSGNIKRSRPPSIAQVLEKSPIMDDVLEKLRPFA